MKTYMTPRQIVAEHKLRHNVMAGNYWQELADRLVASHDGIRKRERQRVLAVMLKHIHKQCSGLCCDNCNCVGVRRAIEAIQKMR